MGQCQEMAACSSSGQTGTLRRQGGIEALALSIKTLEHGQAFGQTSDEISVGDRGHVFQVLCEHRTTCTIIAQACKIAYLG